MPRRFAIAAGPSSALSCLICAASMLTGPPLYLPAAFALAMPSRCRSSMISRSHAATPARWHVFGRLAWRANISADARARIFERFERAVGPDERRSGFGVGLWVVGQL